MKPGPSIIALAAGALLLAACSDDAERTAENQHRNDDTTIPSTVYPDATPSAPSTAPPIYPNPDAATSPPPANPDAPVNPDGTLPPNIPPATTPPT